MKRGLIEVSKTVSADFSDLKIKKAAKSFCFAISMPFVFPRVNRAVAHASANIVLFAITVTDTVL